MWNNVVPDVVPMVLKPNVDQGILTVDAVARELQFRVAPFENYIWRSEMSA
jgi:hypothetical protein